MTQDNRPAVYLEEPNKVIYRASALGHCLRELWAHRTGLSPRPIPAPIQKAMDEGTEMESFILNLLWEKHNFSYAYGSQFQVELNVGAWNGKTLIVRGALDEIGGTDGVNRPIDVKKFSQPLVDEHRSKPLDRYLWQQSVYCHAYEHGDGRYYMPIYNKNIEQIEPWSLVPLIPKYSREQIRDRVIQVEEAAESGKMPDDCPGTYGCVFPYLHDQRAEDELPDDLIGIVRARIKLSEKIKIFTEARGKLDRAIAPKLTSDTTYRLDGYTISAYNNPDRFNTAAAKQLLTEAGIDWEHDEDFIIRGIGTAVRMTPPKARNNGSSDGSP